MKKILNKNLYMIYKSEYSPDDIHNIALAYVIIKNQYKVKTIDINFPNRLGGENSINLLCRVSYNA